MNPESPPEEYIRELIKNFRVPPNDTIVECLLRQSNAEKNIWDSGIFISNGQRKLLYPNIFHFWVRAFFCFVEDMLLGEMFQKVAPFVVCREISVEEFGAAYHALLGSHVKNEYFEECQAYPQSYVEIDKRSFSAPYVILDQPNIKSSVASSDGEYVAYFQTVPKANH